MKKLNLLLVIFFLFAACNNLNEAKKVLKNEKTFTSDEFLVKKKEPLTQPPDFDEIPEPGSIRNEKSKDLRNIEDILSIPKEDSDSSKSSTTSTETSILNQIKK